MKNALSPTGFLLLTVLAACSASKPGHSNINQGISGYIYQVRGNQMPAPGRAISRGRGLSCEVYIYSATQSSDTRGPAPLFSQINTPLITQIKSDSTGRYTAYLPPGRYSLFIKENNLFFANETDGNGYLNFVEVKSGLVSAKDFRVTLRAVY